MAVPKCITRQPHHAWCSRWGRYGDWGQSSHLQQLYWFLGPVCTARSAV